MKFSKELIDKCISLYREGRSYQEISNDINLSTSQSWGIIQRHLIWKGGRRRAKHPQKEGERHNRAKLTDAQVLELLQDYNEKLASRAELSEKYGIGVDTVSDILRGMTRKNNPEINEYRSTITLRDERGRRKKSPVEKKVKTTLHFSAFNNENGEPIQENENNTNH